MGQLYTIGYANLPIGRFLLLLQGFSVDYVIDVRSLPYSRHTPQYNEKNIRHSLAQSGIGYAHMGKHFGARQDETSFYGKGGCLDFEKFRASGFFRKGLENVRKGLEDHTIALMCAEKRPEDCHRSIMVARGFELAGVNVMHILHDGSYMTQNELNAHLLNRYFPDRRQISLFREENRSEDELLAEAYRLKNREIGYSLHGSRQQA